MIIISLLVYELYNIRGVYVLCSTRLLGLTDGFYDEIKSLPLEENDGEQMAGFDNVNGRERKFKKRKVTWHDSNFLIWHGSLF